jgi:hypothetical protein
MPKVLSTFSLYDNGRLVDRRYVTDEDDEDMVDRVAAAQGTLASIIDNCGGTYLVDIEFWDGEHVRWGTDENGMVFPVETGIGALEDRIERMRQERGTT